MDEEEPPGEDFLPSVTTEEAFQEALRALVTEADANGVDVRGGWPIVRGDDERAWDIEITGVSRRSRVQADESNSLATAVVDAVAEREGVNATTLPPLYDTIEPDILDVLRRADATDGQTVTFEYAGYTITVDSNGSIVLDE